jgi:DNA-binding beta-propeller fold protein YncE
MDEDGDGYGEGCSRGPDCDERDPVRNGPEICDMADNDCDGLVDEGAISACGDCDPGCESEASGVGSGSPFDPSAEDTDGVGLDSEGALILDSESVTTNHIWIANTGEGTVSKFDTETYEELGRYPAGPLGRLNDPSRTSVNGRGDVFIGNRGGASITRISGLGAGCPDTNGDGVVTTSTSGAALGWGTDDCILWHTNLGSYAAPGRRIRAVAAQDLEGPDGELLEYVWVGAWDDNRIFKLDGLTGEVLLHTESPVTPYGFALDQVGNLWISTRSGYIGRLDTTRCIDNASCNVAVCDGEAACDIAVKQRVSVPITPYGITVDFNQRVWIGGNNIVRYDPMAPGGSRIRSASLPFGGTIAVHGIAADASGYVWGAGNTNGIVRVDAETLAHTIIEGSQGHTNKGIAVDGSGKVWSITRTNRALVVTPGATLTDYSINTEVARSIVAPYTYSDMTGLQLRLATNPRGYYRRIYDACEGDTRRTPEWSHVVWESDVPAGTTITIRARTAETRGELAAAPWVGVAVQEPDRSPASLLDALTAAGLMSGYALEVEVVLQAERRSTTEVISPRLRSLEVGHRCTDLVS